MDFTDFINGRDLALVLVDNLRRSAACTNAFAWSKLDRIGDYIKRSTIQMSDEHFANEDHV